MKLVKETFIDALRIFVAVICLAYFVFIGYMLVSGHSPLASFRQLQHHIAAADQTEPCSPRAPLNLTSAPNAQLARLATYQQACRSFAAGTIMTFVGIPLSSQDAATESKQIAATLKVFARYHVRPLVVAEPRDYTSSSLVDVGQFAQGAYTSYLTAMFAGLQRAHVTSSEMGIWNPFPEANLPEWKDSQPQYFAPSVNLYVSTLKHYYPAAQTSIMLNAASYAPTDTTMQQGQYVSLLPYLQGITPHSIDYAGLEGFPWLPPRGQAGTMLDAAVFLKPSIISEAADYLGTKNIWLNTGTFSAQYTGKPSQTAHLSTSQRQIILGGIDTQARTLQKQGYQVAVNLFAQDKSDSPEQTNWSYWSSNTPSDSSDTPVLTDFVSTLNAQRIDFWLYDN